MERKSEIISGVLIAKEENGTVRQVLLPRSAIFTFLNFIEARDGHVDFFSKDYSKLIDITYEREDDGETTDIVFPYRQEEEVKSALKSAYFAGMRSMASEEPKDNFEEWYAGIKAEMVINLNIKENEATNTESTTAADQGNDAEK